MRAYFRDLPLDTFAGTTVVLDVDGTLLPDGDARMHPSVHELLARLAERTRTYLASNARDAARLEALAAGTRARVIRSSRRKPDIRVLEGVERGGSLVVIGDKHLTDGLLAAFSRARFVKVRTLRNGRERLGVRLAYVLDAILGPTVCFIARLLP